MDNFKMPPPWGGAAQTLKEMGVTEEEIYSIINETSEPLGYLAVDTRHLTWNNNFDGADLGFPVPVISHWTFKTENSASFGIYLNAENGQLLTITSED